MSSATLANVSASATSVAVFAADTSGALLGRMVFNDSSATLYLKFGTTASTTSFTVRLDPSGFYEFDRPVYNGVVHGIWSAANGAARTTVVTS